MGMLVLAPSTLEQRQYHKEEEKEGKITCSWCDMWQGKDEEGPTWPQVGLIAKSTT